MRRPNAPPSTAKAQRVALLQRLEALRGSIRQIDGRGGGDGDSGGGESKGGGESPAPDDTALALLVAVGRLFLLSEHALGKTLLSSMDSRLLCLE